jgi:hypothetical protein
MPFPARIPSQLWLILATLIGGTFLLSDLAPKPMKAANHSDAADPRLAPIRPAIRRSMVRPQSLIVIAQKQIDLSFVPSSKS